jgi:Plasmid pRiA4b ORF-3-like protein
MMVKSADSSNMIYQLKVTLRDSKPPIWRRVMVPGSFDLYKLHQVIQVVMGWTDSHLHHFLADGTYYSFPYPDSDWEDAGEVDSQQVTLAQIAPHEKRKFTYEYDFGDSWDHEILVEKILPPETETKYPWCIAGKRACPPEDVGGIWGYYDFLEALNDPNHDEHDSYMEWWGGYFDPEEFDIGEVNQVLQEIK